MYAYILTPYNSKISYNNGDGSAVCVRNHILTNDKLVSEVKSVDVGVIQSGICDRSKVITYGKFLFELQFNYICKIILLYY